MKSAQRRRIKKSGNFSLAFKKVIKLSFYLLLVFFIITAFIFVFTDSENWDGKSKLNLTVNSEDGEIKLASFDPNAKELTIITIPSDTQVNVARALGVIKSKNLWELGENEGLEGVLVSETLTRDLKLINYLWADSQAQVLFNSNILKKLSFLFKNVDTNLSIKDKFKLTFFSMGLNQQQINNVNLGETGYFTRSKLVDGSMGYVVNSSLPPRIITAISDSEILENRINVFIEDETSSSNITKKLGEIIEVFGGKISLVENRDPVDSDCVISGKNKIVVSKLSKILDCQKDFDTEKNGFDIKLTIGDKYAQRF